MGGNFSVDGIVTPRFGSGSAFLIYLTICLTKIGIILVTLNRKSNSPAYKKHKETNTNMTGQEKGDAGACENEIIQVKHNKRDEEITTAFTWPVCPNIITTVYYHVTLT